MDGKINNRELKDKCALVYWKFRRCKEAYKFNLSDFEGLLRMIKEIKKSLAR